MRARGRVSRQGAAAKCTAQPPGVLICHMARAGETACHNSWRLGRTARLRILGFREPVDLEDDGRAAYVRNRRALKRSAKNAVATADGASK